MIINHIIIYFFMRLLPAVASLLSIVIFTRLLSPAEYGVYSLTMVFSTTLATVFTSWIVISTGRFLPACTNEIEEQDLLSSIRFIFIVVAVFVLLLFCFLYLNKAVIGFSVIYSLAAVLCVFSAWNNLNLTIINAKLSPSRYGIALCIKNITLILFGMVAVVFGFGANGVLVSAIIAAFLSSLIAKKYWKGSNKKYSLDSAMIKKLFSYGAPLTFLYLFAMLISFSDRFFIDHMINSKAAGLYSVGYDLTEYSLGVIGSVIHLSIFPIIVKTYEREGEDAARKEIAKTLKLLIFLMTPATLGFIAISNDIAHLFLGDAFVNDARKVLPWIAIATFFSSMKSYYFDYAFQLKKTTWLQAIPVIIAGVVNLILNYVFLKKFGMIGAAYSTCIAYLVYMLASAILGRNVFNLPRFPYSFSLKTLISACMMFYFLSIIPESTTAIFFVFKVFLGVSVFTLCSAVLNLSHSLSYFLLFHGKLNELMSKRNG